MFNVVVLLTLILSLLPPIFSSPLGAAGVISTDSENISEFAFTFKLSGLIAEANTLLMSPVHEKTINIANKLYNSLNQLLEKHAACYNAQPSDLDDAKDVLQRLSSKFKLQSPLPDIIPIQRICVPIGVPTLSVADLFKFALEDHTRPLTQTEAYLSRPELQKLAINSDPLLDPGEWIGRYTILFARAIEQERAHREHYVFYHAQDRDFILFYDILSEILRHQLSHSINDETFRYIRIPTEDYKHSLEDMVSKEFFTDITPEISKLLLSVHLSLFGSSHWYGESTLHYYVTGLSIRPPKDLLEQLFNKFNLNQDYIPQLKMLFAKFAPREGNLLQIFIPKNEVNKYVYLSQPFGRLLKDPPHPRAHPTPLKTISFTDQEGKLNTYDLRTIDTQTYLDIYRTYPQAIHYGDMDQIQGRILITDDFVLNPKSGIKIYAYDTRPPHIVEEYKKQLRLLMHNIFSATTKPNSG